MNNIYDVCIVGAGSSGLFAAIELATQSNLSVLLIEQVKRLHDTRNVSNGWMGGSAKSDVKLFIEPGFGGEIDDLEIIGQFLSYLQSYTGHNLRIQKPALNKEQVNWLTTKGVEIDEPATIVVSADKLANIELLCRDTLRETITIKTKCQVRHVRKERRMFEIETESGTYHARKCMLAMGRGGSHWMKNLAQDFDLTVENNAYDLGVRLEFPHQSIRRFSDESPHFRVKWNEYRTSALSIKGMVEMENVFDIKTSNGRSMTGKRTLYSNFALLKTFEHENALDKALNLVQIANILADGQLLREPVSRLLYDRSVLSPLPEFASLKDGLRKIFELFPGIEKKCVLYAPEARLNVLKYQLSKHMESEIRGLYIIGDMSGKTKSFVQSACSGLLAAKHIVHTIG